MKRTFKGLFTTGIIAASLLAPANLIASSDMFLKMDGVMGESADAKHKGEIDVLSWSWGESAGTARVKKGVLPSACIQDLSLMKQVDSSTPALIMNTMIGQVSPTAVLSIRKSGEQGVEFLRLTMKNVTISAYQTSGSAGGDDRPTESVTLHFESMDGQYVRQLADGRPDTPITWQISNGNTAGCQ